MSDRVTLGDSEHRELRRKMNEESSKPPPSMDADDSEELLTLKLMVGESTEVGESNNRQMATSNNNRQRKFCCKFCDKKFGSSQALGGHQNAHRRERVLSKIDRELDMGTFGHFGPHHFCPYSVMANLPFTAAGSPFYAGPHHHHHHMNPLATRYGFQFGSRSSWAEEEGAVQQRRAHSRSNNVQSSSPANTEPDGAGGTTAGADEGLQRNSPYMGSISDTPSSLDLSLGL